MLASVQNPSLAFRSKRLGSEFAFRSNEREHLGFGWVALRVRGGRSVGAEREGAAKVVGGFEGEHPGEEGESGGRRGVGAGVDGGAGAGAGRSGSGWLRS